MRTLIIIFLVASGLAVYGQSDSVYTITGRVIDKTQQGMPGATIRVANSRTGLVAGNNGYFSFKSSLPVKLITTYIGFIPDTTHLTEASLKRSLEIRLNEDSVSFQEVFISAQRFNVLAGSKDSWVIDYAFSNELIYVLLGSDKGNAIEIFDAESNRRLDSLPHSCISPNDLFIDCFGGILILTPDSAEQIYYQPETRSVISVEKYHISKFNALLRTCKVEMEDKIVYEKDYIHQHRQQFTAVNKSNHKANNFFVVNDSLGAKSSRIDLGLVIAAYYSYVPPSTGENIIEEGLWNGELIQLVNPASIHYIGWYENISLFHHPNISIVKDDKLFIYDNTFFKLHVFDKHLKEISSFPTLFTTELAQWKGLSYLPYSGRLVSRSEHNGYSTFDLVDINSGKLTGERFKLRYHQYVERPEINHKRFYYLHRVNGGTMKLVSQEIEVNN